MSDVTKPGFGPADGRCQSLTCTQFATGGPTVTSVLGPMCATIDFLVGDPIDIAGHLTNVPPAEAAPKSCHPHHNIHVGRPGICDHP